MKIKIYIYICVYIFFISLAGCASIAVSDDAIVKNTSFTLGVEASKFTISDRVDDGFTTTYRVKTADGANFKCYVTGTVSVVGKSVSDAICRPADASGLEQKPHNTKDTECNALLSAAGKC
jgi:hypothetical protein